MAEPAARTTTEQGAVATQRLFFALWPTEVMQQQMRDLARGMLAGQHGKLVVAHNLHLTLLFLGSVTGSVRQCLEKTLADIHVEPYTLVLDQAGYWRKSRILWLGCSVVPAPLLQLVRALSIAATGCGLEPETRPYRAHVTVARKVSSDPGNFPPVSFSWPVRGFTLMESSAQTAGVLYRPVRHWGL